MFTAHAGIFFRQVFWKAASPEHLLVLILIDHILLAVCFDLLKLSVLQSEFLHQSVEILDSKGQVDIDNAVDAVHVVEELFHLRLHSVQRVVVKLYSVAH